MKYSDLYRRQSELTKLAQVDAYQQETEWSCSAAALKAVLQHYGQEVPEEEVIQAIGARKGRGAETTDIVEGARRLGFDASEGSFPSLDEAKETLRQGVPIIADVQSFNYPGKGHYIVIAGFKPGKGFIIMDPNTKGKTAVDNWRVLSEKKLEEIWWDRAMAPPHELMPKWGVMVKPKEQEKTASGTGFSVDIDKATTSNPNFRKVLFTGPREQLVAMSIPPGEDIGTETHPKTDQFIRVEEGKGKSVMGGKERPMPKDTSVVVPSGTRHNIVNTGKEPLKLYSVYSPPHHPRGTVDPTKADALAREKTASPKNPTAQERFYMNNYKSHKKKKAAGDIFGWNARRRAKAESASSNPMGFKYAQIQRAAFVDEMCKIASGPAGSAFDALSIGAKAGGFIGGARQAMKDGNGEESKLRQIIGGISTGAIVGALLALGLHRNATGKTTLPRF